jgi:hypothetical protein
MDTLLDRIRAAYPAADPMTDFAIMDAGYGAYLATWNIDGPLPEGVVMGQTALQEFGAMSEQVLTTARQLVRLLDELDDLLDANPQVVQAAQATAAGALVVGSSLAREQVLTAIMLKDSTLAYLDQALNAEALPGVTVRQAIQRRG